jgi:HEAT repeat protein
VTSRFPMRWLRRWQVLGAGLLCGLTGCAQFSHFWDEITSRERDIGYAFGRQPDPLVTLRDSTDNQRKADALRLLKEPLKNNGTKEEQELYLSILSRAALNEGAGRFEPLSRDPYCRLSALRTLGEYQDPRALQIIEKAYFDPQPFTQEMNALIRQQALAALEKNGNPEVRLVLIRAARQPNAVAISSPTERQQILDERIAAVRALGRYSQYDAVDTLVHILETEKDVALRDCAHESLKKVTQRDLPEDGRAWRELLARGDVQRQPEANVLQRVAAWIPHNP